MSDERHQVKFNAEDWGMIAAAAEADQRKPTDWLRKAARTMAALEQDAREERGSRR